MRASSGSPRNPNYSVKRVETIADGVDCECVCSPSRQGRSFPGIITVSPPIITSCLKGHLQSGRASRSG